MPDYSLLTKYGERADGGIPLPEYPRPQLRRDSYLCLNGKWDFAINKTGRVPEKYEMQITLPYPVESALSGIRTDICPDDFMIYSRSFTVSPDFIRDITWLHFGAVDCVCRVNVNGHDIGEHTGGYLPFTFDISDYVRVGENKITLTVTDETDTDYPIGKQSRRRGGIWYTPVSGVWQSVWLESVCRGYIRDIRITSDLATAGGNVTFEVDSESHKVSIAVYRDKDEDGNGEPIAAGMTDKEGTLTLHIPDAHPWSPDDPYLYRVTAEAGRDKVTSYFAMRSFEAKDGRFLLNGKPYFVNGLLDQGYFSDGIYTPASYEAYADDIRTAKSCGFNALRKHIKIEPAVFYHYCDTLGILVLQDMVNTGKYSFFKDTILPFAGLRSRRPYVNAGAAARENFASHAAETLRHLYNCPSVVYYTIFNEGWGQFDGDRMYTCLASGDKTRVYDATSGWFSEKLSDVDSRHIYFKPIKIENKRKSPHRPLIISEFGGYSLICPGHVFNTDKNFGYRGFTDASALEDALIRLYEEEVLANIDRGLSGAIYTQLSDVEDETNGLLTYDRKLCKVNPERLSAVMKKIYDAFASANGITDDIADGGTEQKSNGDRPI